MKVKDVMTEVQAEITAERKERIKYLLKEKQLELDAARKVLAILKAIAEFEEETGVEIQSFRTSERIDTSNISDLPCRTSSISEIEYEFK